MFCIFVYKSARGRNWKESLRKWTDWNVYLISPETKAHLSFTMASTPKLQLADTMFTSRNKKDKRPASFTDLMVLYARRSEGPHLASLSQKKKKGGGVKNCFHRILFPPSKIIIWFSVLTVVRWGEWYAMNLWLYHLIRGHRRCEYIQTVCRILFSDPDMVWTMLSAFFHLKHKYKSFKEYFLLVPHFTLLKLSRNSVLFLLLFN